MTMTPQRSADSPELRPGAVVVPEELPLAAKQVVDGLYDLHANGYTLADLVSAWCWLDWQREVSGG